MTALMQAIDFQDYEVIEVFLRVELELAQIALHSPKNKTVFNLPITLLLKLLHDAMYLRLY